MANITQANLIYKESAKKHMVIIGTSFVGMEVAAALWDTAASDSNWEGPCAFTWVGKFMLDLHRKKGVQFCLE